MLVPLTNFQGGTRHFSIRVGSVNIRDLRLDKTSYLGSVVYSFRKSNLWCLGIEKRVAKESIVYKIKVMNCNSIFGDQQQMADIDSIYR